MLRRVGVLVVITSLFVVGAPVTTAAGGDERPRNYKRLLRVAIADIERYWEATYPTIYGDEYEPVEDVVAAHPGTPLPDCLGEPSEYADVRGNAYYCPRANYIAYDDEELFPFIFREFGEFAPALIMAHEWGHAIQDRARLFDRKSVFVEIQADCFAGAWLSSVGQGGRLLELEGGELDTALAALLFIRDAPGSSPDDPGAHGSAFDRAGAFQTGFVSGPAACAAFYDTPPLVVEIPFATATDAASGGNLRYDKVLPAAVRLLNDFYAGAAPAVYQPLAREAVVGFDLSADGGLPECGGVALERAAVENRVIYCAADRSIRFHRPYLQHVLDDIGDFGVITLIADAWATHVQTVQGFPGVAEGAERTELGADCYSGAFAGSVARGELQLDRELGVAASLSPGDLDESVQAFLDSKSALGIDASADLAFSRFQAFRDGFFAGYASCAVFATPG